MDFDPHIAEKICNYVRFGADHDTAALAAGLRVHILDQWKLKGLQETNNGNESGDYATFIFSLSQAEAQCELMLLQRLIAGGEGAQNAKFILERISERWGTKAGPDKPINKRQRKNLIARLETTTGKAEPEYLPPSKAEIRARLKAKKKGRKKK